MAFLVFFFFFLPPMAEAPAPAQQQHNKARSRIHCQICNWDPQEPEVVKPELADPEESLALDPVLKESPELEEPSGPEPSELTEAEDAPEPEEADESIAVIVVVAGRPNDGSGVVLSPSAEPTAKRAKKTASRIMVLRSSRGRSKFKAVTL